MTNTFTYCAIQGELIEGEGNITIAYNNDGSSPDSNYVRFADPVNGDFRLVYGSACINAGTPDISGLGLPSVDLQGLPRVLEGRIDMGAYEYYPVPVVENYDTVCEGSNVVFFDSVCTVEGSYVHHTHAEDVTLDTLYVLHLSVNQSSFGDTIAVACENFTWQGTTYSESGSYSSYQTNSASCDSIVTLHLTINQPMSTAVTETACESFSWNGETYTQSGDYTQTFTNLAGCDSVVTLHLTINHAIATDEYLTICENELPYHYTNGQIDTIFDIGTPELLSINFYLLTESGCDSIVTLHLTITVGVDDYDDFDFKVYPNPTSNVVNVQCTMNNVQAETFEIRLYDAYGRLLDVAETGRAPSLQTVQIDLSRYAKGVYFVKAVADGKVVAVRKIVKQ